MGKSYRKPYVYMTKGVRESHKDDKRVASGCFRSMCKQALQACEDWDELLTPHRYEAKHNNVYSWAGDGHARYEGGGRRWRNLGNPYYFMKEAQYWTDKEIMDRWIERNERNDTWDIKIRRK